MKKILCFIAGGILLSCFMFKNYKIADPSTYLNDIKTELKKEWPGNRTINLVFHGHSVPSGYFKTPVVNTFGAYPYQLLKELKAIYPYAVINVIITAIGGENSINGAKRFESDVLTLKPDVIFIDYGLNDRRPGLDSAKTAWESMIKKALDKNIKVILLTPSPDLGVNILQPDNILEKHAVQIKSLAEKYNTGFVDSYDLFRQVAANGGKLEDYMSQGNHPNEKGHTLIVNEMLKYFR